VKAVIFIVAAGLAGSGLGPAAAAKAPGWTVYADCAAAYLANARVPDPDRPAAMVAQVSDVANDYAAAARVHYRRAKRGASAVVQARIDRQTRIYSGQPREAVERVIDACPQVGG
jgi:hypothetical protein